MVTEIFIIVSIAFEVVSIWFAQKTGELTFRTVQVLKPAELKADPNLRINVAKHVGMPLWFMIFSSVYSIIGLVWLIVWLWDERLAPYGLAILVLTLTKYFIGKTASQKTIIEWQYVDHVISAIIFMIAWVQVFK